MGLTTASFGKPKKRCFSWWAGELGWLACWFAPILRLKSREYSEIRIGLNPDWAYLVEDFATAIPLKVDWSEASFYEGKILEDMGPPGGYEIIRPGTLFAECGVQEPAIITQPPGAEKIAPREWCKLGIEDRKEVADILCAFRPPKKFHSVDITAKSYPLDRTEELVGKLLATGLRVAAVGWHDNYFDSRLIDLRGIPLSELCGIMREAKVTVGPSSGPLHLATLSECPVVTWNSANYCQSKWRYSDWWNPFAAPVEFIASATNYKHPEVDEVIGRVEKLCA